MGTAVEWVNLPAPHRSAGSSPSYYTSGPASCHCTGKAAEDGPSSRATSHVGDKEAIPGSWNLAPGSWFWPGTHLGAAATWKVNSSLCLSHSASK